MMQKIKLAIAIIPFLAIISCGNSEEAPTATHTPTTTTASNKKILEAEIVDGKQEVILMAGDDMKFNAKEVKVKANTPVVLTLKHTGKMPLKSMGHNVVILTPETVVSDFANAANAAVATNYIPEAMKSNIVAYTKMLGGGESDQVTFSFTTPGTYPFLCSFPGHSGMMKGKFIVE